MGKPRRPKQRPESPDPGADDFLGETVEFWQARSERTLTREDAREIISNVAGFLSLLAKWDAARRRSGA